nr:hypothetical protein [Corynebacterium lactis]
MTKKAVPLTIPVAAASRMLGISPASGYRAIQAGDFPTPARRINGRYVVATRPLLDFLGLDEVPAELLNDNHAAGKTAA